ncbi:MAG: ABC transporter ATP-binding protein [Bacteroidota bacterium]
MNASGRIAFLWSFARPWRGRIAWCMAAVFFVSAASLLYPWLLKLMADRLSGTGRGPDPGLVAIVLVLVFLASSVAGYVQQVELQTLGYRLRNALRVEFFSMLLRRPLNFFGRERAGELSSRAMEDFSRLQPIFANLLAPFLQNGLVMAGCLIAMASLNFPGATIVLLLMVIPLPSAVVFSRRITALFGTSTALHAESNALLEESIVGIRDVKAFGREKRHAHRYAEMQGAALEAERSASRIHVGVTQSVTFLMSILLVSIFFMGTADGRIPDTGIGDMIAFYFYAYTFLMAAIAAGRVFLTYRGIAGAFERSHRLMCEAPPPPVLRDADAHLPVKGRLEVKEVHFAYDGGPSVLNGASLAVEPGETLLLTGPSGSGKSTLGNLIIGLLTPAEGEIRIGGHPLTLFSSEALLRGIGYAGQDPVLFRASARENIEWGGAGTDDERLREVLAITALDDVMKKLPQGLETVIGERGVTLSGGEKARFAIARAIMHRPPLLLLDEVNAMLGERIERHVWRALLRDRNGLTTIIMSHHHEYLPRGYRVVALRDGRLYSRRPA